MIVVSDTSALNYLVLIGHESILPELFGAVYAPPAVIAEMQHSRTPDIVKHWIAKSPDWLIVRAPAKVTPIKHLDPGELEAISLAQELKADLILIDERNAVAIAEQLDLPVIGTLNVLQRASRAHLLELPKALAALKQTTFRASVELIEEVLRGETKR